MTSLPPSGSISLKDLQDYFGGDSPISFSEYVAAVQGVPDSSDPTGIGLADFYGKSGYYGPRALLIGGLLDPGSTYQPTNHFGQTIDMQTLGNATVYGPSSSPRPTWTPASTSNSQMASNRTYGVYADQYQAPPGPSPGTTANMLFYSSIINPDLTFGNFGYNSTVGLSGAAVPNGSKAVFTGGRGRSNNPSPFVPSFNYFDAGVGYQLTIGTGSSVTVLGTPNLASPTNVFIDEEEFPQPPGFVDVAGGDFEVGMSNGIRGVIAVGRSSAPVTFSRKMKYFTIENPETTTTDFGTLNADPFSAPAKPAAHNYLVRGNASGTSGKHRGIIAGGVTYWDYNDPGGPPSNNPAPNTGTPIYSDLATNRIDYISIPTTGNSSDFGNLTSARRNLSTTTNNNRVTFAGGEDGSANATNTIEYVNIHTTGNAADFGDLDQAMTSMAYGSGSAS